MKLQASYGTAECLILHLIENFDFAYVMSLCTNIDTVESTDIYFDGDMVIVDVGDLVPNMYRIGAVFVAQTINLAYSEGEPDEHFKELVERCFDELVESGKEVLDDYQFEDLSRYRRLLSSWAEVVLDGHTTAICRISPAESQNFLSAMNLVPDKLLN